MTDRKPKLILSGIVLFITIAIALAFDVFAYFILTTTENKESQTALIALVILLNVIYFISVRIFFAKSMKSSSYPISRLSPILDQMLYLTPEYQESYEVLQNESASLTIEEDLYTDDADTVEILKPKEIVYVTRIYDKDIKLDTYIDHMYTHFIENGLEVKKDVLRVVLASLAGSRIIHIKQDSLNVALRFMELLTNYLGTSHMIYDEMKQTSKSDALDELILAARQAPNIFQFMTFYKTSFKTFENHFEDVLDYAYNPVHMVSEGKMPNNLWFFIMNKEAEPTPMLTDAIFSIDLSAKVVEPKEVVHENELKLSFEKFSVMLRDSEELHYLEESHWKKLDQLEAYINTYMPYRLDNQIVRQLEKFSTIFALSGGEQLECLDSILATKLLYIVKHLKITKKDAEDEGFIDMLDKIFDLEYLRLSRDLVKLLEDQFLLKNEVV